MGVGYQLWRGFVLCWYNFLVAAKLNNNSKRSIFASCASSNMEINSAKNINFQNINFQMVQTGRLCSLSQYCWGRFAQALSSHVTCFVRFQQKMCEPKHPNFGTTKPLKHTLIWANFLQFSPIHVCQFGNFLQFSRDFPLIFHVGDVFKQ